MMQLTKRIKKKDLSLRDKLVECGWDSKEALKIKDIYKGNILVDGTRGQVHVGEIIDMILDMFEDIMSAGPIVKEPCIKAKVILTDMKLHDAQQEGNTIIIKAKMPVAEMFGWSSDLRSSTSGRGSSSLIDQMFEKLPEELQDRVIKQIRDRKGLTEAQVGV